MVFHLPNDAALHDKVDYASVFVLTVLWNVGLLGMLLFLLFSCSYLIKKYILHLNNKKQLKDSMLTVDEPESSITEIKQSQESTSKHLLLTASIKYPQTICFRIVSFMTSFFFYCFWITASLIYLVFYMFGYFGRQILIDVLSVIAMALVVIIPTLLWKYRTKVHELSLMRKQIIVSCCVLCVWVGVCIFLVIATKGMCICHFNDKYGIKVDGDMSASSAFTRQNSISWSCGEQDICHLYATLPEDSATSVFINAHSGVALDYLLFNIKLANQIIYSFVSQTPFRMDNVEKIGQRNVHSILIKNLTANTTYVIEIKDKSGTLLKTANYKTVPDFDAEQLRLAIGGDLGMTKSGQIMTSYLSSFSPDVIILGGDTVYDNGMRNCYYSWDNFYRMFEPVYEKLNRLVPIVMSIGNHDVGFNALTSPTISRTEEEMPLFFVFNPQHSSQNGNVPLITERQTIHYHKLGPTIHVHLDSGYVLKHKDQAHFIRSISQSNPNYYKFANYHNPIYPSCTNPQIDSNDRQVITEGLKYWTPIFDQFNFIASLEHHTHYRKFSKKIKNSTVSQMGTRYIGDGSWGVKQTSCKPEQLPSNLELIEHYANKNPNHLQQVVIKKNDKKYYINYTAVGLEGTALFVATEQLPQLI